MPPVHIILRMLGIEDTVQSLPKVFYLEFAWVFFYGMLMIVAFFLVIRKKQMY